MPQKQNQKKNQVGRNLNPKIMKKQLQLSLLIISILTLFTSCQVIGNIFKAGIGVGIFIVFAVIAVIIFIMSKLNGKK